MERVHIPFDTVDVSMKIWSRCFLCLAMALGYSQVVYAEDEVIPVEDDDVVAADIEEDDGVLELNAIEISESPEEQIRNGTRPPFAQVISQPQLQSINDWLESANGVYGDASGKGTRNVIVRGFEGRQLTYDFEGMPLDTGYDGMTGLDVLPMNWIGSGRIAHADAVPTDDVGLGGKIDLYSFSPKLFEANLELTLTGVTGSVAHGMKKGPWEWAATAGGRFSNGFYMSHAYESTKDEDGGLRDYSGRKGGNFLVKAGRELGNWGKVELISGWAQAPRGVPTGINTGYRRYWDFTSWRVAFVTTRLQWKTDILTGQVQLWATDQGNTLEAYDSPERNTQKTAVASTSIWQDDDYGGRIDLGSPVWSLGKAGYIQALFRTDLRYQRHESNEDTYALAVHTDKDSSRFYYAVRPAIDWQITPSIHTFISGNVIGAKALSQHTTQTTPQPGLEDIVNGGFSFGFDYAVIESLDLNLRVARRMRLPTLKEQFRSLPGEDLEIPTLKPETGWDMELEAHWKPTDWFALTVGVFDTEIRDLIEFRYTNQIKLAYNVAKSRIAGVDASTVLGPWYGLSLDLSYHYLYAYDLSQDHVLNDRPAHNFRFAAHYAPIDNLKFTIGGQYESKRRTEAWLSTKSAWMGQIFLLNAEIEYKLENVYLYLRGTNLTDYNYARAFGYPEPGFELMLGANLTM
ncbi:MAG: TonB-dependent receptor plug domain-containing protein [Proteobacteria bacterium]|nr:TonB-dependent receptor plug domain-containing protein [Pseudomonadota bacterium]